MRSIVLTCVFFAVAVCVRHEEKSKKLVRIIYSLVDRNDDGLISREELANTFSKYDSDGNKGVDRKEFVKQWQIATSASEEESVAAFSLLDSNGDGVFDKTDVTALYKNLDTDKNGEITDREFLRRFQLLLSDVPYVLMFSRGDKNADGEMTEDEFDQTFQLFDLNGDGTVDAGEFVKLWVTRRYNDVATTKRLYGKLDVNGDDRLDKKSDLRSLFLALDISKDGKVTQGEFVEGWAKVVASISRRP